MLCVVGPVVCCDFSSFFPLSVAVDEREQNRAMEGKGESVREGIDTGFMCDDDDREERVFRVGELVEYWVGAFVRGYRTRRGACVREEGRGGRQVCDKDGGVWKRKVQAS